VCHQQLLSFTPVLFFSLHMNSKQSIRKFILLNMHINFLLLMVHNTLQSDVGIQRLNVYKDVLVMS